MSCRSRVGLIDWLWPQKCKPHAVQYRIACTCHCPIMARPYSGSSTPGRVDIRTENARRACSVSLPGDQILAIDASSIPNALCIVSIYRYIGVFHICFCSNTLCHCGPQATSSARYPLINDCLTALDMHTILAAAIQQSPQQMTTPLQRLESALFRHGTTALGLPKLSIALHFCCVLTHFRDLPLRTLGC